MPARQRTSSKGEASVLARFLHEGATLIGLRQEIADLERVLIDRVGHIVDDPAPVLAHHGEFDADLFAETTEISEHGRFVAFLRANSDLEVLYTAVLAADEGIRAE